MPERIARVIPIRRDILASDAYPQILDLTFRLWLETNVEVSPHEEDLVAAVRESKRTTKAGLFLVPKRKSNLHPFLAARLHLS
jgi:hypothetical protein